MYAGDRLLAQEATGEVTYYHPDRLSVRLLTNVDGKSGSTQSHEPFGEHVEERFEVDGKWRFTNYERDDETGTDYAVNRQYLTSVGRFMRPDPVDGNRGDPQSLNRYAYARNDPINFVDPLGLLFAAPGGCPAQFSSCGEVEVCINGWCLKVPVGYDGGGGGVFRWDQLPPGTQARLSDMGRLPRGFQILPSFADLTRPLNPFDPRPEIEASAQTSAQRQIAREYANCDKKGTDAAQAVFDKGEMYPEDLEIPKDAVPDMLGFALWGADAAYTLTSTGALFTPLGPVGLFLTVSYSAGSPTHRPLTERESRIALNAQKSAKKARKDCRKAVQRKYGLQ